METLPVVEDGAVLGEIGFEILRRAGQGPDR
jgi:hypothetical protein